MFVNANEMPFTEIKTYVSMCLN